MAVIQHRYEGEVGIVDTGFEWIGALPLLLFPGVGDLYDVVAPGYVEFVMPRRIGGVRGGEHEGHVFPDDGDAGALQRLPVGVGDHTRDGGIVLPDSHIGPDYGLEVDDGDAGDVGGVGSTLYHRQEPVVTGGDGEFVVAIRLGYDHGRVHILAEIVEEEAGDHRPGNRIAVLIEDEAAYVGRVEDEILLDLVIGGKIGPPHNVAVTARTHHRNHVFALVDVHGEVAVVVGGGLVLLAVGVFDGNGDVGHGVAGNVVGDGAVEAGILGKPGVEGKTLVQVLVVG